MSVPLGGTISTMVTKSPLANFCPRRERCSIGTAGIGVGPAPLLTSATAGFGPGSPPPRKGFILRKLSGGGSQHPPNGKEACRGKGEISVGAVSFKKKKK